MTDQDEYAIGIDFGTTKSLLSYMARTTGERIPPMYTTYSGQNRLSPTDEDFPYNRRGLNNVQPVPTHIAIDHTKSNSYKSELEVGFPAINPRSAERANYEVISNLKELSAQIGDRRNVSKYNYAVEGLIANFLWSLRKFAKEFENIPFDQHGVTITVPAKAGILQRMTMQFAASVAGFSGYVSLLEEPVAAFLFHRHLHPDYFGAWQKNSTRDPVPHYALVIDFGGGTCDLAIIRYKVGEIPIVIGRAMAYLGGNKIDELFLRAFWFNPRREHLPFTWDDFTNFPESYQTLLKAHARQTKELLSSGAPSHIQDITGALPYIPGVIRAPVVTRDDLKRLLEVAPLPAIYSDIELEATRSVKDHLLKVIDMVIASSIDKTKSTKPIERSNIAKIIYAGGSSQLPGVKDWVLEFLESENRPGIHNKQIRQDPQHNILSEYSEVCVAGGAAIHQLYKHHSRSELRQVITPTLSTKFWLTYYQDDSQNKKQKIILGMPGDILPIKHSNYQTARLIYPAKLWGNGKMQFIVGEGEEQGDQNPRWSIKDELPDVFGGKTVLESLLKGILIKYLIDEHGILRNISWTPGSLLIGWRPKKSVIKYDVFEKEVELGVQLERLRSDNIEYIKALKKLFIPGSRG